MSERTQDRRVRKTRKLLRQSLFQLMEHKRVQDITVREITELSDLNRGTFYIHYKDVFDMVEQIERELFEDFNQVFEKITPDMEHADPLPLFIELFRFLKENADVCRVLVGPNGDMAFVSRLKKLVRERCLAAWKQLVAYSGENNFNYYYAFIASGFVGLIDLWYQRGMPEAPETMALMAEKMIIGCMRGLA
jgi:AcrR family transcriptional regulator